MNSLAWMILLFVLVGTGWLWVRALGHAPAVWVWPAPVGSAIMLLGLSGDLPAVALVGVALTALGTVLDVLLVPPRVGCDEVGSDRA